MVSRVARRGSALRHQIAERLIEIIRRDCVQSLAMLEEINGCPHEEGRYAHFGRTGDAHLSHRPNCNCA
jgi:hypothetical protein